MLVEVEIYKSQGNAIARDEAAVSCEVGAEVRGRYDPLDVKISPDRVQSLDRVVVGDS